MDENNQILHKTLKTKLATNIVINWFIPMVLVILMRKICANDTIALAISGIVPLCRTIILWIRHRLVDWIGLASVIGFIMALTVSILLGGSSLPLKLYHPIVTGTIGFVFILSTIIGKPLLVVILRALKHGDLEQYSNPVNYRKFKILTVCLGFLFFADAVIHIVMAFTLPTITYVAMSKAVTISIILMVIIGKLCFRDFFNAKV